ncbi:MAG TPA: entericidin A/B family lipoprotein [Rhodocyclaceae bacterium]
MMLKLISALMIVLAVTACNTVHGIGRDIEKGGEAIQKATK